MKKSPRRKSLAAGNRKSGFRNGNGNNPLYLQLAQELRRKIMTEGFEEGSRFYSIRQLMKDFDTSLATVRSAIELLTSEGLLQPREGSGLYVTRQVKSLRVNLIRNFLVVFPHFADTSEAWFTGRIVSGLLGRTRNLRDTFSFYKRLQHLSSTEFTHHLLATQPKGVAWLHYVPSDFPFLEILEKRNIPIVTTMRQYKDWPMIQEDNRLFAQVACKFLADQPVVKPLVVLRSISDPYYQRKYEAIQTEIGQMQRFSRYHRGLPFFELHPRNDSTREAMAVRLGRLLDQDRQTDCLLALDSEVIYPILRLLEGKHRDRLLQTTILYNVLAGDTIPELPGEMKFYRIEPPLEEVGYQIAETLDFLDAGLPVARAALKPVLVK